MAELSVYFARAMDERDPGDIIRDDENYAELLSHIGGVIKNLYEPKCRNPIEDGLNVAQHDLELLNASDIVLADMSIPNYQYVGCIFEIVHAAINNIPVVLVNGQNNFHNRYFIQAYCNFIAKTKEDAVEYIERAYTKKGIEKQMEETHAYYNMAADKLESMEIQTKGGFEAELNSLRKIIRKYVTGKTFQVSIGTNQWTKSICENASEVIVIYRSKEMIDRARSNLSSYSNISFLHGDIFENDIKCGPFDCIVIYFFLSLLPPPIQKRLLNCVRAILKPGGMLIVADTLERVDFPSIGLGRCRLQEQKIGDKMFTLYKERFYSDSLVKLLEKQGFDIVDSSPNPICFSWAVSRNPF